MSDRLTASQFCALYAIGNNASAFHATAIHTGQTAYGRIGENAIEVELFETDYAALLAAGLVHTVLDNGHELVLATSAGRELLASNPLRCKGALTLVNIAGGAGLYRAIRNLRRI